MFGWIEICLLLVAVTLFICGLTRPFRLYRALLWGSSALMLITALFPRHGNLLGQYLFGGLSGAPRLPMELFGIAWWILGAWLVQGFLDLILRRTWFPDDNEPHARRLLPIWHRFSSMSWRSSASWTPCSSSRSPPYWRPPVCLPL